jgi:hypothetical protein
MLDLRNTSRIRVLRASRDFGGREGEARETSMKRELVRMAAPRRRGSAAILEPERIRTDVTDATGSSKRSSHAKYLGLLFIGYHVNINSDNQNHTFYNILPENIHVHNAHAVDDAGHNQ